VDKFDRIFQVHAILSARRTPIALEDLMARLECSKSTLHRAPSPRERVGGDRDRRAGRRRHGAESPEELREDVGDALRRAAARYS
jgi:hypothetical protein